MIFRCPYRFKKEKDNKIQHNFLNAYKNNLTDFIHNLISKKDPDSRQIKK